MSCTRRLLISPISPISSISTFQSKPPEMVRNVKLIIPYQLTDPSKSILNLYPMVKDRITNQDIIDVLKLYGINSQSLAHFIRMNLPIDNDIKIMRENLFNPLRRRNPISELFYRLRLGVGYQANYPDLNIPTLGTHMVEPVLNRLAWVLIFISKNFNSGDNLKILTAAYPDMNEYPPIKSLTPENKSYYEKLYNIILDIVGPNLMIYVIDPDNLSEIYDLKSMANLTINKPQLFIKLLITAGLYQLQKPQDFNSIVDNFQQIINGEFTKKYKLDVNKKIPDRLIGLTGLVKLKLPDNMNDDAKLNFISNRYHLYWSIEPSLINKSVVIETKTNHGIERIVERINTSTGPEMNNIISSANTPLTNSKIIQLRDRLVNVKDPADKKPFIASYGIDSNIMRIVIDSSSSDNQYNFIHSVFIPTLLDKVVIKYTIDAKSSIDFLCYIFPSVIILDQVESLIDRCIDSDLYNIISHDLIAIQNYWRLQAIEEYINIGYIAKLLTTFFNKVVFTDAKLHIRDESNFRLRQIYKEYNNILTMLKETKVKSLADITDIKTRQQKYVEFKKWINTERYTYKVEQKIDFQVSSIFESGDVDQSIKSRFNTIRNFLEDKKDKNAVDILNKYYQLLDHQILAGMYNTWFINDVLMFFVNSTEWEKSILAEEIINVNEVRASLNRKLGRIRNYIIPLSYK